MGVIVDDSSFKAGIKRLDGRAKDVIQKAVEDVALEVLRLSQIEVPHDTGALQNSGHTEHFKEHDEIVGYNKVYAAKLHEHPEYHFQAGRKGKYLEDPIKNNNMVFRNYFIKAFAGL
jgi:hypothetical protein